VLQLSVQETQKVYFTFGSVADRQGADHSVDSSAQLLFNRKHTVVQPHSAKHGHLHHTTRPHHRRPFDVQVTQVHDGEDWAVLRRGIV